MERRKFIRISGVGTGMALFGASNLFTSCQMNGLMDDMHDMMSSGIAPDIVEGTFDTALPVPPSTRPTGATLIAQQTTAGIFKRKSSGVLGYQTRGVLGPTLRAARGDAVNVKLQNNLSEPTNIHWHGLITPAESDGHPKDVVQAGGSLDYRFPVVNRAGTYWYHPHPDLKTAKQTYEGLAGFFLVTDPEEQALDLPSGEFDLPIVIQDKRADLTGNLVYSPNGSDMMNGLLGESLLVNGVHSPIAEVSARWYRLRLLNGSNARIYNLALSNGASFTIIASDGGLLASPLSTGNVLLAPGERADVLVNFGGMAAGTEVFLESKTFGGSDYQGRQNYRILKFKVREGQAVSYSVPSTLSAYIAIPQSQVTGARSFDITNGGMHGGNMNMHNGGNRVMHTINGKSYDEHRIDETVVAGSTEIWTFDNSTGIDPHPMHLHGVQFQVLGRAGGRARVFPHESGWKDTVLVMPGEKVRVIIPFGHQKGDYVFHCHILEHEDSGMMGQMEIR